MDWNRDKSPRATLILYKVTKKKEILSEKAMDVALIERINATFVFLFLSVLPFFPVKQITFPSSGT